MTHRIRVVLALAGLVLATVAATWLLAGRVVLRPLIDALLSERVETALYLAGEVEDAPVPADRAWTLAAELGVEVDPVREPPAFGPGYRKLARDGREVWIRRNPRMPLYVPLRDLPGIWGVEVTFPVDIHRPPRRVGTGFALIAVVVLLGAVLASRWTLRPLEATSRAMARVAAGDLEVRVPEGRDAAGRMGATFNRMAERVEALVRGQRRLMAAVSHEVRSPLARMRLTTELLRDAGVPEGRLATLEADIGEVDALVGDLMESVRLEEGVVVLDRRPLRLRDVAEDALGRVSLGDRPVSLEVPTDLELPADRDRLRRVLVNLLANVARYTPPDAPVRISARTTGARVELDVEDGGPGVSPADLPHVFEPFYRAEASRDRRTGGVGLGLMLVRQVVEAHGGRASADNLPGGGLRVRLVLPGE